MKSPDSLRVATGRGPFSRIVGQPRATGALGRSLASDRLCPSLIFHGPPQVGKLATALELARALLCTAPRAERPCGDCRACRRIDESALLHPDVRVVFPETVGDFEKGEQTDQATGGLDLQGTQSEAAGNPVWVILMERLRRSIAFLQRRPSEGALAILIIDQAHRMEATAANALLKTLEEPPPHACVLLLTSSYYALLPTLRSRCQAFPFQLVPTPAITDLLVTHRGLDPQEAALRAGLSGGRIGAALDLDLEQFRRRRETLLALLEEILTRGDPGLAVARAEAIVRGGEGAEADLEILMTLLRDLLVLQASPGGAARLVNLDLAGRLLGLTSRIKGGGPAAVEDLEATIDAIRRKGNRQLLVENFLMSLLPSAISARSPA
ncbi:MAG TPA: hypothetical protein VFT43_01845 [Candidatus Polarisedimenticolia bacterium]|nr:hypothetical protein [Candidatus Polarisedimenticolia bacterium]